jgi:outer membrane protein assembly factor BamA
MTRLARMSVLALVLAVSVLTGDAHAQTARRSDAARAAAPDSAANVAAEAPDSGWLFVLPVVAYSPETKFAFGASAGRYYRFSDDPDARPTTTSPLLLLTTNNQLIAGLFTDAWWDHDRWHLAANLNYTRFPTEFYGIGDDTPESAEETFEPRTAVANIELQRRVKGALYLGGILDIKHTSVRDVEAGGLLDGGDITGADGGMLWGLGAAASWDSRDSVFWPAGGWYSRVAVVRYLDVLGGDHAYTWTDASVSRYWGLGRGWVLAGNVSGSLQTGGDVPFYQLSRLMLRGYFEERYRDRHVVRARAELRLPVRGRLGAAVFAGVGELASTVGGLRLDEARPSGGVGLRFNVGGDDKAHLRLDFGWGDGDSGVYIRFGEAF